MQQLLSKEDNHKHNLLRLFNTILRHDQINTLSIIEPWGTLISIEDKHAETRSYPAKLSPKGPIYVGPLGIHTSKKMDDSICYREPFSTLLQNAGYQPNPDASEENSWNLPLGQVIAIAWMAQVWQVNQRNAHLLPKPTSLERQLGNFQTDRYVWSFDCVYRLKQPIPTRGAPFIWKWNPIDTFWNEIQEQADLLRKQISTKK